MCLYTTCRAVSLVLLLAAIDAGSSLAQEAQIRARQRYCAVCHGEQGTGNARWQTSQCRRSSGS